MASVNCFFSIIYCNIVWRAQADSILVARHGHVAYQASFGKVAPGRAPSGDDRYLLMSMSKAYTATLVLKAIDEGRFGLDTRIADLVPGFGALGKQRATLRQLLAH